MFCQIHSRYPRLTLHHSPTTRREMRRVRPRPMLDTLQYTRRRHPGRIIQTPHMDRAGGNRQCHGLPMNWPEIHRVAPPTLLRPTLQVAQRVNPRGPRLREWTVKPRRGRTCFTACRIAGIPVAPPAMHFWHPAAPSLTNHRLGEITGQTPSETRRGIPPCCGAAPPCCDPGTRCRLRPNPGTK